MANMENRQNHRTPLLTLRQLSSLLWTLLFVGSSTALLLSTKPDSQFPDVLLVILTGIWLMGLGAIHYRTQPHCGFSSRPESSRVHTDHHEELSSIFRVAPVGIGMAIDRRLCSVNQQLCNMTGYSEAELIGEKTRLLYIDDEEYQRVGNILYRQLDSDIDIAMAESRFRTKQGDIMDVLLHATPMHEKDRSRGITFTVLDITSQKKHETTIRHNESRLRLLMDSTTEAIIGLDRDYTCSFINRTGVSMLGYSSASQLNGTNLHQIIHRHDVTSDTHGDADCPICQAMTDGEIHRVKYDRFFRRDGSSLAVEYQVYPVRKQNNIVGVLITFLDISDKLEVEKQKSITEYKYRVIFDNAPEGIWLIDPEFHTLQVNKHLSDMLGYSEDEMLGRTPMEFVDEENKKIFEQQTGKIDATSHRSYLINLLHRDGHTIHTRFSATTLRNSDGSVMAAVAFVTDLSDQKRIEDRLRQSAIVFENTSEGVMITDTDLRIIAINRAFSTITGYEEHEVLGHRPSILSSGKHDKMYYQAMWNEINTTGSWQGEIWNRRRDGSLFPEWLTITAVYDDHNSVVNYVGVFSDITQIKYSQERLDFLAHHDPLTELPNRLLFHARLEHAIARTLRENTMGAVLYFDLDRFKQVNDSLGHSVGDALLQQVSARLINIIRKEDTFARMGGDEFTILIEQINDVEDALVLARKITQSLEQPFEVSQRNLYITASVGISLFPKDGITVEALLKNADTAMYRAKADGRNTFSYYSEEMTDMVFESLQLETQLRHAIDNNELILHYQPQFSLQNGELVGFEALVRWLSPERGLIPPDKFIPIAIDSGLIVQLGEWVLHTACAQASEWLNSGYQFGTIAVNVDGVQIERGNLVETVQLALEKYQLPAEVLELEVTENFVMHQGEKAIDLLKQLRALGVTLSIDDFGTGYSSLSYLKLLPIHKLKIDKGFVKDLPDDENDKAITQAVIALGHSMQFRVIAEGVETEEQQNFLMAEGCDEVQGYFYSRPREADGLITILTQRSHHIK